jgi:hypothetical protein
VKSIFVISLVLIFFSSCKEQEEKKVQKSKNESFKPFVFNLQNMWTDFEKHVSFPNWFNDSIITSRKIGAIHRNIYEKPATIKGKNLPDSIYLKEKISYYFYPNGHIKCVSITSFVEGEKIGTATFNYENFKDKFGYNFAILSDTFSLNPGLLQNHYQIDTLLVKHSDYLNFMEKISGNHLYVVLNNKKLDAFMIDSILRPNFSDWIMQGNPRKPSSLYRLKNKVNQLQLRNFSYNEHNNQFFSGVTEHFPFETRRDLSIKDKMCYGFSDRIYSNEKFLFETKYIFFGSNLVLPDKVIISKSNSASNTTWETVEYYKYEIAIENKMMKTTQNNLKNQKDSTKSYIK